MIKSFFQENLSRKHEQELEIPHDCSKAHRITRSRIQNSEGFSIRQILLEREESKQEA